MTDVRDQYEAVIGLEVHAQLLTRSKIFCGCSASFGAAPNTHTCPVCMGLPGALPVLNQEAVEYGMRLVLALGGSVRPRSVFARKNYFYPDLPKGYQISQYDCPLGEGGTVEFDLEGRQQRVGLIRIHLEEDAGKSLHPEQAAQEPYTFVDLNRCGVPLLEIVSQPDIRSAHQAAAYMQQLRRNLEYLGICTGSMEEGALRCDANVSVRRKGSETFGTRTEVKNMNSFKSVERAILHEIDRQLDLIAAGEDVVQQTLLWDEASQSVAPMRSKEESSDYRYFPEPDLPVVHISDEWIADVRGNLPELPLSRAARLVEDYGLPAYDAGVLTDQRGIADLFEAVVKDVPDPKLVSNWIMTEVLRVETERHNSVEQLTVQPAMLAELLRMVRGGTISGRAAKDVFEKSLSTGKAPKAIVAEEGLEQISDDTMLEQLVEDVLNAHPEEVTNYRAGNARLLGFFMGQLMQASKGKGNPNRLSEILREKLGPPEASA